MAKLTKEFVENEIHLTTSGQRFYRDDDVPGFAIRVTRKCKSYILERRIAGSSRRITIGKCSDMSFDSAKKHACRAKELRRGSLRKNITNIERARFSSLRFAGVK